MMRLRPKLAFIVLYISAIVGGVVWGLVQMHPPGEASAPGTPAVDTATPPTP